MQNFIDFLQGNKQRLKPIGFFFLTILGIYGINSLFSSQSGPDDEQQEQNNNKKPAGIMNEGNTCFVNSLLQSLSSCQSFNSNIQSLLKLRVIQDDNEQLIRELHKVIKMINGNKTSSQSISVMDFLTLFSKSSENNIINFEQQDAYELYSGIVRSFDEFFNKRKQSNLSLIGSKYSLNQSVNFNKKQEQDNDEDEDDQNQIQNCLIGYTKSSIQCMSCQNTTTIKVHSFYDLSLQIQPNFINSLKAALIWFERTQKIQHYACTNCSIKAHIAKLQQLRKRLDKIEGQIKNQLVKVNQKLIQYLKRNIFEEMDLSEINEQLEKQVIEFTDIFHKIGQNSLRNQIFSLIKPIERQIVKQTKITKYPRVLVIHFKQLIINPYTGQPAYMRKPIDYPLTLEMDLSHNRKKKYILTSVLTHIGNQMMGHYFTFRKKNRFDESWYMISDSHTQLCNEYKMKKYIPYMLFYELHDDGKTSMNLSLNKSIQLVEQEQK